MLNRRVVCNFYCRTEYLKFNPRSDTVIAIRDRVFDWHRIDSLKFEPSKPASLQEKHGSIQAPDCSFCPPKDPYQRVEKREGDAASFKWIDRWGEGRNFRETFAAREIFNIAYLIPCIESWRHWAARANTAALNFGHVELLHRNHHHG